MGEYKGESSGKKLARLNFWKQRNVELLKEPGRRIVVLASKECGDISMLKGLGVPSNNILAIDTDQKAIEFASTKHPDVNFIWGDVADVCESLPSNSIDVAFLDFCAPLNKQTIETAIRVSKCIKARGVLGVGTLRGRENNIDLSGLLENNQINPGVDRKIYDVASGLILSELRDARESGGSMGNAIVRSNYLMFMLYMGTKSIWPESLSSIMYQSRTKNNNGVPMLISTYRIHLRDFILKRNKMRDKFTRRRSRSGEKTYSYGLKENIGGVQDYRCINDLDIRDYALANADDPSIYLKLNISRGTVAAWKAHKTMGTYSTVPFST